MHHLVHIFLLSIVVDKSLSFILDFIKLNLSSDTCTHLGIDKSDFCFGSDSSLSTFDAQQKKKNEHLYSNQEFFQ